MGDIKIQKPNSVAEAIALLKTTLDKTKQELSAQEEEEKLTRIAQEVAKMLGNKESVQKEVRREFEEAADQQSEVDVKLNKQPKTVAQLIQKAVESPATNEDIQKLHDLNDDLYLASQITGRDPRTFQEFEEFFTGKTGLSKQISKALSADVAGAGAEWAPTGFSTSFIERVETERVLRKFHPEVTVPKGVKDLDIGAAGAAISIFYYPSSESSDDEVPKLPAQTAATRKVTLRPRAVGCRVLIPEAYELACALPIASIYKDEMIKAYARGLDNLFINGDTNASPLDSDLTSSLDIRKVADGYRRITATNGNTADGGTLSVTLIRNLLAEMGNYSSPNDCILLTSWQGFWKLASVSEIVNWATYNGTPVIPSPSDLGKLMSVGTDVVVSDQVRSDLNASGVYDGTTTTKTLILVVNRKAFIIGKRNELTLKRATDPETGRDILIAYAYVDFEPAYATSEVVSGLLYNIG